MYVVYHTYAFLPCSNKSVYPDKDMIPHVSEPTQSM